MSSKAALVNEKHYQAKLILALLAEQDTNALSYAAQVKAVESSAVLLMHSAFMLFLAELAESCQIKQSCLSVESLAQALAEEGRSHAVVETLLVLQAQQKSWLHELLSAQQKVSLGLAVNEVNKTTHALQFSDISEEIDVNALLQQFTSFVQQQRSFLSEW